MKNKSTDQRINTEQKINAILNLIKQANQIINNSTYKDIVLVLGNSGVGKTPFTKWMTEDNTKLISVKLAPGQPYLMQDIDHKIGTSTIKSATVFPDLFVNKTLNQAYYDFPGFHDTRGMSYGIATMYSIQGVISNAQSVKMVFLVDYDSVKSAGSRDGFTNLMKTTSKFVKDIGKYANSIALVVSKVPKYINDEPLSNDEVIQLVANFIQDEVKPNLEKDDHKYYTQTIKFIDTILLKNGTDYPRIGLFRFPDKAGPFSNISWVQQGKERIEKIIYEKLHFTPVAKDDFICAIDAEYQNEISNIVEGIKNILTSHVKKIGEKIKQHFLHIEETVADIGLLYNKTSSGYYELSETQKNATILTSKECIELVSKNSATINSSVIDSTLLDTIIPYTDFLAFLDNNKISQQAISSFKCTTGLDKVVEYLNDAKTWYGFLNSLYDRLSNYEIQRNTSICNNLANNISTQNKDNTTVKDINLEPFLKQCYPKYEYNDIKNIILDESKCDTLNKVLDFTLRYRLDPSCNDSKLLLKGHYVKLSDVHKYHATCPTPQSIEIFALYKVFIDTNLDKTGKKVNMAIIAPTWDIQGIQKIILDGEPGKAHIPTKARDGLGPGNNGEDGKPGLPGGPAGNFLGIGAELINGKDLTISANGGKGGPGQHGGDGANGKDGTDPTPDRSTWDKEDFISKQISFRSNANIMPYATNGGKYYSVYNVISPGKSGGNGGNGGIEGKGGHAGNITIFSLCKDSAILVNHGIGDSGVSGNGGKGGKGGKNGKSLTIEYSTEMGLNLFNIDTEEHEILSQEDPKIFANSGKSGIAGSNTVNMEKPEAKVKFLNPSHTITSYKKYLIKNLADGSIKKLDLEDFKNFLDNKEDVKDLNQASHSKKRRDIDDANNKQVDNDDHNDHVLVAASTGSTLKPIGYNLGSWLKGSISQLKYLDPVEQIKNWFYQNVKSTEQSQLNIADNVYQDALSVESSNNIMGIKDDRHDEYLSERVYHELISDDLSSSPMYGNYDFNIHGSLTLANLIVRMITGVKYDNNHILNEDHHKSENIDMDYTHRIMFSAHVPVENSTDNIELLG